MNHPIDGRLIATSAFRDAFAQAILEGVGRYRSAITGQASYQAPSAVAVATDKTSIPDLRRNFSSVGISPSLNEAVQRAAETLKKSKPAFDTSANAN